MATFEPMCPTLPDGSIFEPGPKPDPYPTYVKLRERSGIYRLGLHKTGGSSHLLTRHADVNQLLRSPEAGHEQVVPESATLPANPFQRLLAKFLLARFR